jgi:hypothetical protein
VAQWSELGFRPDFALAAVARESTRGSRTNREDGMGHSSERARLGARAEELDDGDGGGGGKIG